MTKKLPLSYRKLYINKQLTEEMKNNLKINYGIDINKLDIAIYYLNSIKSNEVKLTEFFKQVW